MLTPLLVVAAAVALPAAAGLAQQQGRVDTAQLTVSFIGSGAGTVTSSPAGLSCSATCQASFPVGTTVTLTAIAAAGSALDDWPSGQCQEQGTGPSYRGSTCTLVLDTDSVVSVYFERVTLTVAVRGSGAGTVTSAPAGIACPSACQASFAKGATVTLTAHPAADSGLDDWPDGQCQEQGSGPSYRGSNCTLVLDSDEVVSVYFERVRLTVAVRGSRAGRVISAPAGIACPSACQASFAKRATVTLTAHPAAGSALADWPDGQCQEQASKPSYRGSTCTLVLDTDEGASVYFAPGSSGTIGGSGPLPAPKPGVSVNLTRQAGTTLVKLPGQPAFKRLVGGAQLPVGSLVDVTGGRSVLKSSGGQSAFSRGVFVIREPKTAAGLRVTELALSGGSFASCAKTAKRTIAAAAPPAKPIRQLFGNGKGRFRTKGRYASATVRGTIWLLQDRCDGTLIRVLRGIVAVTDLRRQKTIIVPAGHSYLARA